MESNAQDRAQRRQALLAKRDFLLSQLALLDEPQNQGTPSQQARVTGNYTHQLDEVNAELKALGSDLPSEIPQAPQPQPEGVSVRDEANVALKDMTGTDSVASVAVLSAPTAQTQDRDLIVDVPAGAMGFSSIPPRAGTRRNGPSVIEPPLPMRQAAQEADAADAQTEGIAPEHLIEPLAGRFVALSALLDATLWDGDHAFSESTRQTLTRAVRLAPRRTKDGRVLVDVRAFVRALIAIGAEDEFNQPETVGQALVAALRVRDSQLRSIVAEDSRQPLSAESAAARHLTEAVAADDLTEVLADAARLTRQLMPGDVRVDLSAAGLAALRTVAAQRLLLDIGNASSDYSSFFSDTVNQVLDVVARRVRAPEVVKPLQLGLAEIRPGVVPERRSPARFVADLPAATLAADRLGMAADAAALAEVICLTAPGPPLAVGLFGDWGAGKSTFMNLLEGSIEQLTGARVDDRDASREPFPFVRKVIHIRFNAWHYNDANLWASLTAEFFSQLRMGGWRKNSTEQYNNIVREVLQSVEALEANAAEAAAATETARSDAARARRDLNALQEKRRAVTAEALSIAAGELVSNAAAPQLTRYERALSLLGRPVPTSKDTLDLRARREAIAVAAQEEVQRIGTFGGRVLAFLAAVLHALFTSADYAALALIFAALVLTAATLGVTALGQALWPRVREVLSLFGIPAAASSLFFGIRRVYQLLQPLFAASRRFESARKEALQKLEEEATSARQRLLEAEKAEESADRLRKQAEVEAARFRGATPEQVFDYYLNVSADTRQFEGQLGTVSHVRRVFEQLNAIYLRAGRLKPDTTPGGSPRDTGSRPAPADRIVLYIDDLDRCGPEQVVRVLEAVHLLLAFPLFVVVVGVDARWLRQALQTVYRRQIRSGGTTARAVASVHDYLEKLFQIPIQLRSLSNSGASALSSYVRDIAGPLEETYQASPTVPSSARNAVGTILTAIDVQLEAETLEERVERVTLRHEEIAMIDQLAPILSKSPRAVKRFMNLYRLIRGRRRGVDLDHFIGGSGPKRATFAAYQFWLAVSTGLSEETAALYRAAASDWMSFRGLSVELERDGDSEGALEDCQRIANALRAQLGVPLAKRHGVALSTVSDSLGASGHPTLLAAAEEVSFYSLPTGV